MVVAAVLLLPRPALASAEYDQAISAYYKGDYAAAYAAFLPLAEQGHARAQNYIGLMHETGRGIERNLVEAVGWYRLAASQGLAEAQTNLGYMLQHGRGVPKNPRAGAYWYRKAAEQGYARAQYNLAIAYENGRGVAQDYRQARDWYRKAAEQGYARAQNNLGDMYWAGRGVEKDYDEAVRWYRISAEQGFARAQTDLGYMYEKGLGVEQDYVIARIWYAKAAAQGYARAQTNLGNLYDDGLGVERDYATARAWYLKAAEQGYARAQTNLGWLYERGLGVEPDLAEAERWYRNAAAQDYARGQRKLAALLTLSARFSEAEDILLEARARFERPGGDLEELANFLSALANLYAVRGDYADGVDLLERAIEIHRALLEPNLSDLTDLYLSLGYTLTEMGLLSRAEAALRQALPFAEREGDVSNLAAALVALGEVKLGQQRPEEAITLFSRAIEIRAAEFGADEAATGVAHHDLSVAYVMSGDFARAFPHQIKARELLLKVLPPSHFLIGKLNLVLAMSHAQRGEYDQAEALIKQSVDAGAASLGADHPSLAFFHVVLSILYGDQGRYAEAVAAGMRAAEIYQRAFDDGHPNLPIALYATADAYRRQGLNDRALATVRRAVSLYDHRSEGLLQEQFGVVPGVLRSNSAGFELHLRLLADLTRDGRLVDKSLVDEALRTTQLASASRAGTAVSRMAARFATGSDALAAAVRARQDALDHWRKLDNEMLQSIQQSTATRASPADDDLRRRLNQADERLRALDNALLEKFPSYAEIADQRPLSLVALQNLLGPTEALLIYHIGESQSFSFVVRPKDAVFHRIDISGAEIRDLVEELREGLDLSTTSGLNVLPQFDTRLASGLYARLVGPIEDFLVEAKHLFVVTNGALTSLPLGLLPIEPQAILPIRGEAYRGVPWLARRFAITVLPSVSSIRALRLFAGASSASRPFIGFGDPDLDDAVTAGDAVAKFASLLRGAVADVEIVRSLPSLPDTAAELSMIAVALGGTAEDVHLRAAATESAVKSAALAQYRVVSFATHGLLAGALAGLPEPGLVLTPPVQATIEDDGFLTASEIAQLKLNADWVVLSACNTAAGDELGAEGLSGLARSFFYAGARTLLVSHWPVSSAATVALITTLFETSAHQPEIGHAEALRRARIAMMEDEDNPYFAHPAFWAPFVVVGEGGTYRPQQQR